MNNFLSLANSLGFLAYASVLVFCSIANPPRDTPTQIVRVSTSIAAIILGTNMLKDAPDQHLIYAFAHTVFLFLVTFSAFKALMKQ
jgi:hypothetical protein